jgi:prepilin-type N-terminal cleavage/methylation domain-containing protein
MTGNFFRTGEPVLPCTDPVTVIRTTPDGGGCNGQDAQPADRGGFTIVELLVAIVILAIGVLGLAGTTAVVARQMTGGHAQTMGSYIAASRFENLSGRTCAGLAGSGTATVRGVKETWSIVASENATMTATVTVVIPDRVQPELYKTVISCF